MGRNSLQLLLRSLGVAQGLALLTLVAFGSLSAQTVSFIARRDFTAGISPTKLAVGDFNRDGIPDLAVTNRGTYPSYLDGTVSVLLGNGDGTFQAAVDYPTGSDSSSVAVGDFNGDGVKDLAVANMESDNVSVLLGNGDGTFQPARNFRAGGGPAFVATGDFDGDGIPDLAVADRFTNSVCVLLGNGDGTFLAAESFAVGSSPTSVAAGDFNGDGVLDLAVANYLSGNVSVLLGNGDGTFSEPREISVLGQDLIPSPWPTSTATES